MNYIEQAMHLTQAQRQALREEVLSDSFAPQYRIPCTEPDVESMSQERRRSVENSVKLFVQSLYNIVIIDDPAHNYWTPVENRYRWRNSYKEITEDASNTLGVEATARYLWAKDNPEVKKVSVLMEETCQIFLEERDTVWVDAENKLHRDGGLPAVRGTNGTQEYYWHGQKISPELAKNIHAAPLHLVLREPGFSIIGGFSGLTKHEAFTSIASDGLVSLYEGGGEKTYWARNNPAYVKERGGKTWSVKPKRFLYDPNGMSGWVSPNVKTVAGAQRSLLRLRLTKYSK